MKQAHPAEHSPEYLREKRREYAAVARGAKSGQGSAAGDDEQFDEGWSIAWRSAEEVQQFHSRPAGAAPLSADEVLNNFAAGADATTFADANVQIAYSPVKNSLLVKQARALQQRIDQSSSRLPARPSTGSRGSSASSRPAAPGRLSAPSQQQQGQQTQQQGQVPKRVADPARLSRLAQPRSPPRPSPAAPPPVARADQDPKKSGDKSSKKGGEKGSKKGGDKNQKKAARQRAPPPWVPWVGLGSQDYSYTGAVQRVHALLAARVEPSHNPAPLLPDMNAATDVDAPRLESPSLLVRVPLVRHEAGDGAGANPNPQPHPLARPHPHPHAPGGSASSSARGISSFGSRGFKQRGHIGSKPLEFAREFGQQGRAARHAKDKRKAEAARRQSLPPARRSENLMDVVQAMVLAVAGRLRKSLAMAAGFADTHFDEVMAEGGGRGDSEVFESWSTAEQAGDKGGVHRASAHSQRPSDQALGRIVGYIQQEGLAQILEHRAHVQQAQSGVAAVEARLELKRVVRGPRSPGSPSRSLGQSRSHFSSGSLGAASSSALHLHENGEGDEGDPQQTPRGSRAGSRQGSRQGIRSPSRGSRASLGEEVGSTDSPQQTPPQTPRESRASSRQGSRSPSRGSRISLGGGEEVGDAHSRNPLRHLPVAANKLPLPERATFEALHLLSCVLNHRPLEEMSTVLMWTLHARPRAGGEEGTGESATGHGQGQTQGVLDLLDSGAFHAVLKEFCQQVRACRVQLVQATDMQSDRGPNREKEEGAKFQGLTGSLRDYFGEKQALVPLDAFRQLVGAPSTPASGSRGGSRFARSHGTSEATSNNAAPSADDSSGVGEGQQPQSPAGRGAISQQVRGIAESNMSNMGASASMMDDGASVSPGHGRHTSALAAQTLTVPLRPVAAGGVRPLGRQWKLPQQHEQTMARIGGSVEVQAALTRAVTVQEHVGLRAFRTCLQLPGPYLRSFSRHQSSLFRQRKCLVDDRVSIPPSFRTDKEQLAVDNALKLHALVAGGEGAEDGQQGQRHQGAGEGASPAGRLAHSHDVATPQASLQMASQVTALGSASTYLDGPASEVHPSDLEDREKMFFKFAPSISSAQRSLILVSLFSDLCRSLLLNVVVLVKHAGAGKMILLADIHRMLGSAMVHAIGKKLLHRLVLWLQANRRSEVTFRTTNQSFVELGEYEQYTQATYSCANLRCLFFTQLCCA
ncbi:hypothetical protein B484DRAFT_453952 [Ochromonadaceae sp. CCMP2298]|nr:hypothetical protein B484DRAFT_453952 [Ochromonadaceae sp. CCMP2298]